MSGANIDIWIVEDDPNYGQTIKFILDKALYQGVNMLTKGQS